MREAIILGLIVVGVVSAVGTFILPTKWGWVSAAVLVAASIGYLFASGWSLPKVIGTVVLGVAIYGLSWIFRGRTPGRRTKEWLRGGQ
jgi:hypothetical protein